MAEGDRDEEYTTQDGRRELAPVAALVEVHARFVVLGGPEPGRRFVAHKVAIAGRHEDCDIVLSDHLVSREHCRIEQTGVDTWTLTDLDSRNGTLVNGIEVRTHPLRVGDRVQIGSTVLGFSIGDRVDEQLAGREKLLALGRLGAGVAHDVNNVLAAISSALEFVSKAMPADAAPEAHEALADARSATRRGAELAARLLSFSRSGPAASEHFDVGAAAAETVELARRTMGRQLEIADSLPEGYVARGARDDVHQILLNLLLNAADAMPNGGRVSVSLAHAWRDRAVRLGLAATQPYLELRVRDEGVGMDEETARHAFEPFFSTRRHKGGTGLGLSMVLERATALGGAVDVETAVGRGTTFFVLIPTAKEVAEHARATSAPPEPPARGELPARSMTILIVDDELLVRRGIRRILVAAGHTVLEASDGQAALEIQARDGARIDAVLLDLDMPVMDGETALRELRTRNPRQHVVVMSGYCDAVKANHLQALGAATVLAKPCESDVVLAALEAGPRRSDSGINPSLKLR